MCMAENRFDRALKQALARWNQSEPFSGAEDSIPEMSPAFLEKMDTRIRENKPTREGFVMTKNVKKWKKAWTAAICAAVVLAGTGCVYAAVPAVREYINMLFLQDDSVGRITEVPEGWIGVYTAEDLESVRKGLYANYILMNDIAIPDEYYEPGGIYENGFTPIGGGSVPFTVIDENGEEQQFWQDTAFKGTFNGNGYVISNLHIRGESDDYNVYVGLFGRCNMIPFDTMQEPENEDPYRHYTGGIIKNLGITDSSVEITVENPLMYGTANVNVGMIAGECDVVAGCYTENVSVSVTFADSIDPDLVFSSVKIGGVAGQTIITDSCWSDADIILENSSAAELKNPYVAGVTGFTNSCVTSYFRGSIQSLEADYGVAGFDATTPPTLLSDEIMMEIKDRFLAADDEWNYHKLASFYAYCRADELQMYITEDISETGEYFYLIDPMMKDRERQELSGILSTIFEGDAFMVFCQENNVKYGAYDNYDLRYEADCTFGGFDFTYIWKWGEDGLPALRLF